jgi:uncharacterized membrane protein YwzB
MEQLVLDYMVDVMNYIVDYLEYVEHLEYLDEIRQWPEYHEV